MINFRLMWSKGGKKGFFQKFCGYDVLHIVGVNEPKLPFFLIITGTKRL